MIGQTFYISGQVVDATTRRGVAELRVEAWDRYQSLLGAATTDPDGRFKISVGRAYPESIAAPNPEDYPPDWPPVPGGYPPDRLSYLFFKVFRDNELVKSTENAVEWDVATGETGVVIEVDAPSQPSTSTEVALHELGESIAVSVASIQQELARYPNTLGAFLLDEIDLNIPVHLRIDDLGQVKTTVADSETPGTAIGQLHLRMRPVLGASQPPPVTSTQSLDELGALSPEAIARLEAERIFSVDDLLRVARNASGRTALARLDLGAGVDAVLDRAAVLSLPALPGPVAESLLQIGVDSPNDFVQQDAAKLAASLSERLKQPISAEDVMSWQQDVSKVTALPLPSKQPVEDQ